MIFRFAKGMFLAFVIGLVSGCLVLATDTSTLDYGLEVTLEEHSHNALPNCLFLVCSDRRIFSCGGYHLYEKAIRDNGIMLWIVPNRLLQSIQKYEKDVSEVHYPVVVEGQEGLRMSGLNDFTNSVHNVFELKYKGHRNWLRPYELIFGMDNSEEAVELWIESTRGGPADLEKANKSIEHALQALLLYMRYPHLSIHEDVQLLKGWRFANARGGNPFAIVGRSTTGESYSFHGDDGRKIGCVRVTLPWNVYVNAGEDGHGLVLKAAMSTFFKLLCDKSSFPGKYSGIVRFYKKNRLVEVVDFRQEGRE